MLPGTGGLTRVVDKRKVRRDLADVFGTLAEGVKGKRAVEWRLVDAVYPDQPVQGRASRRAPRSWRRVRPAGRAAAASRSARCNRRSPTPRSATQSVTLAIDRRERASADTHRARARQAAARQRRDAIVAARATSSGRCARSASSTTRCCACASTSRRSARSSSGPRAIADAVLAVDDGAVRTPDHWLVREIVHFMKRTLKRLDLTARASSRSSSRAAAFAGSLFELALAADRSYMLDDPDRPNAIALSRDERRAAADEQRPDAPADALPRRAGRGRQTCSAHDGPFDAAGRRYDAGLVTFAPDELDWDDEVRLAVESARRVLARRADRHGSEPPLRRARDDGDQDLRPADGLAELDLPAPERRRRARRAHARTASRAPAGVRLEADVMISDREDSEQRQPVRQQAAAARARALAAELHRVVERHGARRGSRTTTRSTCAPRSASTPTGWAHFDYVKMPDYRWGIFLAEPVHDRRIGFGDFYGPAGVAGGARASSATSSAA